MPSTRAAGVQSSNIVEGSRKRLRSTHDGTDDGQPVASAAVGAIERRINSLSREQVNEHGFLLLNTMLDARDPNDGSSLSEPFMKLPSKRQYPDYYAIIKKPMTLEDVRQRLQQSQYNSLPEVKHDCETICNNAKRYNVKGSDIFEMAKELHSIVKITYVQIVESLPEPGPANSMNPAADVLEVDESFDSGKNVKDTDASSPKPKRILLRQSRSQQRSTLDGPVPSHVPVAATATRSDEARPETSEPQSRNRHSDQSQASPESDRRRVQSAQRESRQSKATESKPGMSESARVATIALERPELDPSSFFTVTHKSNHSLEEGKQKSGGEKEGTLRVALRSILASLRKVDGDEGYPLSDFFDELPSREEYPDYYTVIRDPICLSIIERRIKDGKYADARSFFSDLQLMLQNAQSYNEPGSSVWNDARAIKTWLEDQAIPSLFKDGFSLDKPHVRRVTTASSSEASKPAAQPMGTSEQESGDGSASALGPASSDAAQSGHRPSTSAPQPRPHITPQSPASRVAEDSVNVAGAAIPSSTARPEADTSSTRSHVPMMVTRDATGSRQALKPDSPMIPANAGGTPNTDGPTVFPHDTAVQPPWTSATLSAPIVAHASDGINGRFLTANDLGKPPSIGAAAALARSGRSRAAISEFSVFFYTHSGNGEALQVLPAMRLVNQFVHQHSIRLPAIASLLVIDFPLRVLKRMKEPVAASGKGSDDQTHGLSDDRNPHGDARSLLMSASQLARRESASDEEDAATATTWPWQVKVTFNNADQGGVWSQIPAASQVAATHADETQASCSSFQLRLLPKSGINVLEIKLEADKACPQLRGLPAERYCIIFNR